MMILAVKYYCDRCQKEIKRNDDWFCYKTEDSMLRKTETYLLCKKCAAFVVKFINGNGGDNDE